MTDSRISFASENMRWKKKLILGIKVLVTMGLVLWLIERVDWAVVGEKIANVSWPLILLYIVLQLCGNAISAKKWQIIASFKGLSFSVDEGFFTYMTGAFINNFLPSTIGGDAYRSLWLAKRSEAKAAAVSTVVFDRFTGLWMMAFFALVFSIFLVPFYRKSFPLVVTLISLTVFFVVDVIITYMYCRPWFHRFIERLPFYRVRRILEEVIFYTKKHIWLRTSFWAGLFVVVGIGLTNFVLFHALGSDIGILRFLSVIFLVTIISNIPISINNIGIKEWAYVTFFALVGVSPETAITVALLSRFLQMFISFIALPQYWRTREQERS